MHLLAKGYRLFRVAEPTTAPKQNIPLKETGLQTSTGGVSNIKNLETGDGTKKEGGGGYVSVSAG